MNRRLTETMFGVLVAAAQSRSACASASDAPRGFSTTQGIPMFSSLIPSSEIFSGGTTAMQPSRCSRAQHFVDVSISRHKAIFPAEFQRALDLQIANRSQTGVRLDARLYIEPGGWHARSLHVLHSRSIQSHSRIISSRSRSRCARAGRRSVRPFLSSAGFAGSPLPRTNHRDPPTATVSPANQTTVIR